eukprot:524997-Prymnesium_polylepis.1
MPLHRIVYDAPGETGLYFVRRGPAGSGLRPDSRSCDSALVSRDSTLALRVARGDGAGRRRVSARVRCGASKAKKAAPATVRGGPTPKCREPSAETRDAPRPR